MHQLRNRLLLIGFGVALACVIAAGTAWLLDIRPDRSATRAFFVRDGDRYLSDYPRMPGGQAFLVDKPVDELRVFVLGGSQAMGDPYVHDMSAVAGVDPAVVKIPEAGGIATWLKAYLGVLYPEKAVKVINAATARKGISTVARGFAQICEIGQPDLVVILSGNNEAIDGIPGFPGNPPFRGQKEFDAAVAELTESYGRHLNRIVDLAETHRVPTYVLTVATNLRDWIPNRWLSGAGGEALQGEVDRLKLGRDEDFDTGRAESVLSRLEGAGLGDHALYHFVRARLLDAAGDDRAALRSYVRAKDNDYLLIRAHSGWNDLVRGIGATFVVPVDMERRLMDAAEDGIPGFDLFHDFCHMKLHGYMRVAAEVARFHQERTGLPPREFPEMDVSGYLEDLLAVLYEIKERKWERLGRLEVGERLGGENVGNVSRQFERERADLAVLERTIRGLDAEYREARRRSPVHTGE